MLGTNASVGAFGGGGGGGSVTAEDIEDALTAPGADTDAVREALDAVPTTRTVAGLDLSADRTATAFTTALGLLWTPDLTSAAGWTDVSSGSGCSVAVTGGTLTGTVGSGAPTLVGAASRAWGGSDAFDLRARLAVTGSTSADAKAHLRVRYGADGFFLVCDGAGGLALIKTLGGFASLATAAGRPIDGTGWVRLRIVGQRVTAWHGTGSGASPPSATGWELFFDADAAALLSTTGPTHLHLGGQVDSGGGLGAPATFAWSSVEARSLAGTA